MNELSENTGSRIAVCRLRSFGCLVVWFNLELKPRVTRNSHFCDRVGAHGVHSPERVRVSHTCVTSLTDQSASSGLNARRKSSGQPTRALESREDKAEYAKNKSALD